MVSGPITIMEDDEDDKEIIEEVLKELNITNKTLYFRSCIDAFVYLKAQTEQPKNHVRVILEYWKFCKHPSVISPNGFYFFNIL